MEWTEISQLEPFLSFKTKKIAWKSDDKIKSYDRKCVKLSYIFNHNFWSNQPIWMQFFFVCFKAQKQYFKDRKNLCCEILMDGNKRKRQKNDIPGLMLDLSLWFLPKDLGSGVCTQVNSHRKKCNCRDSNPGWQTASPMLYHWTNLTPMLK